MKTRALKRGAILACLLLSCAACTGQKAPPLQVRASDPITVTQTVYTPLQGALLNPVEAAMGFSLVWHNGDAFDALAHDSRWLDTCKGQLDGIRDLYDRQAKTQ